MTRPAIWQGPPACAPTAAARKSALPDRELAAQLLTELEIPALARAELVARMPPTTPEVHVARDIARFLAPAVAMKHGEIWMRSVS